MSTALDLYDRPPGQKADRPRLVADIGGTNARFALLSASGELSRLKVLACADYPDIVTAVHAYLAQVGHPRISEAAFAIANPLVGDEVRMSNHSWAFSIKQTRQSLGLERLIFRNDFTALAMSIPTLPEADLLPLGGEASDRRTPLAVIGPGTGLGVSGLVPVGDQWFPIEGEGGHVSCSPGSARELEILRYCWGRFGHVSAERLVSGPGLQNIYQAICSLEEIDASPFLPDEISRRGMDGADPHCAEALAIFCGLLGSVAGDLVLTLGAFGGVYIGGGIVPHLVGHLETSEFRTRFEAKGRMQSLLKKTPAYLINAKNPALKGIGQVFCTKERYHHEL